MMDSENEYPERDFPWTFYFNGEAMPRWTNCFFLVPLRARTEELMDKWDAFVGYSTHLFRIECRIDHVGDIESESPHIFRVCCLAMAFVLLRDEVEILESMSAERDQYPATPAGIVAGVRDGLFAMHKRCLADDLAFWTSGYERNQHALRECIRRHQLPLTDPDRFEAPHVVRERQDAESHLKWIRSDIISLIGTRPLSKHVRTLIHALPKIT